MHLMVALLMAEILINQAAAQEVVLLLSKPTEKYQHGQCDFNKGFTKAQNIIFSSPTRVRVFANTRPMGSTSWPQKLQPAIEIESATAWQKAMLNPICQSYH